MLQEIIRACQRGNWSLEMDDLDLETEETLLLWSWWRGNVRRQRLFDKLRSPWISASNVYMCFWLIVSEHFFIWSSHITSGADVLYLYSCYLYSSSSWDEMSTWPCLWLQQQIGDTMWQLRFSADAGMRFEIGLNVLTVIDFLFDISTAVCYESANWNNSQLFCSRSHPHRMPERWTYSRWGVECRTAAGLCSGNVQKNTLLSLTVYAHTHTCIHSDVV